MLPGQREQNLFNYENSPHGSYQTNVGEPDQYCYDEDLHPLAPRRVVSPNAPILNHKLQAFKPNNDSASSPDTLPNRGYTLDQLANYIIRQLGSPQWVVELTKQQILDKINDALVKFSMWKPMLVYGAIRLEDSIHAYLEGVDVGQGIVLVEFVESRPAPTELFYGNLISPAPILSTGIDDYDLFLRWRKTWMRSSSVMPQWRYDEVNQVLNIHNPVERYTCGITCYFDWNVQCLPKFGAVWVKEYSLALCELLLSKIYSKYSGAIPSPGGALQLDTSKKSEAQATIDKLEAALIGAQESTPMTID